MKIDPNSSATYRICISGNLDETWGERLGGMSISDRSVSGSEKVTSLEGELNDQAALFGILMTIYDLRLPLLSVEFLGGENE